MLLKEEKQIADDYVEEISKSGISKDFKLIICPFGYIASGKSTVVKPIAKELKIPRISGDEIRKKLKENNINYDNLYPIFEYVGKHFLDQGFGMVIDSNTSRRIDMVEKIIDEYKLKKIYIKVIAPEEFILNKIRNYKGEKFLTENQDELVEGYFSMKSITDNIFNNSNIIFDYEIDTSSKQLEANIINIIEDIKKQNDL